MATRAQDQELIAQVADEHGVVAVKSTGAGDQNWELIGHVIPSFGWHPWFSHHLYDDGNGISQKDKAAHYRAILTPIPEDPSFLDSLPEPRPISHFLVETENRLQRYPLALVGEIGLDRSFRIPNAWGSEEADSRDASVTPGGREGRRLSPHRVRIEHQKFVLMAQLRLAGVMQRAVSVHGVQAHGVVFETLQETWYGWERESVSKRMRRKKALEEAQGSDDEYGDVEMSDDTPKPFPPRICLHSYSGPPEPLRQYFDPAVPADIYFSFSSAVNFSTQSTKAVQVIKAVPADRLLIESDLHLAGDEMDRRLEQIARVICELRGWPLDEGVRRLGENWRRFTFG
ncbi:MAG: hypothetical protein M1832_001924 [Thelocarpon impressellum]|nr:MAG: hypothetical protein M1832_001924 [Thelocarpon impressellum]